MGYVAPPQNAERPRIYYRIGRTERKTGKASGRNSGSETDDNPLIMR